MIGYLPIEIPTYLSADRQSMQVPRYLMKLWSSQRRAME